MRTSFHHQPEAQHPNFPLSTSRQADYPIFRGVKQTWPKDGVISAYDPSATSARSFCCDARGVRVQRCGNVRR